MSVSISGITSLGNVTSVQVTIDNSLIVLPTPSIADGTTAEVSVINLLGKTRRVSISGLFYGSEAEITAFVTDVNAWVNSGFQDSATFTSIHSGSFSVLCDSFSYSKNENTPNHISYNLELIEGSKLGLLSGIIDALGL